MIFQYFLNLENKKIKMHDWILPLFLAIILALPSIIFYFLDWIENISYLQLVFTFLFLFIPMIFTSLVKNQSKFIKYTYVLLILMTQSMIFALSHGVYVSKVHFYSGLIYGFVYLKSKSIIPPLISHYTWNFLMLILLI
ncbi:MAG: type II CAAX prenyl endopeptidase Rce1 family protein [Candidatus Woesearchaeota archaeon]